VPFNTFQSNFEEDNKIVDKRIASFLHGMLLKECSERITWQDRTVFAKM